MSFFKFLSKLCAVDPFWSSSQKHGFDSVTNIWDARSTKKSTEKSVVYGFLWVVWVYGQKMIYGRIYGFFLTRFGYYPPTIALSRLAVFYGKNDFLTNLRIFSYWVRLLPPTLDSPSWTFWATTQSLRISRNSDWATLKHHKCIH